MNTDMSLAAAAAIASVVFGMTWLVQWLLQPLAPRLNLLDHPKGRKDHAHPTPITGGIAMAVSVIGVTLMMQGGLTPRFLAFALAAALVTVVGLLDDRYDLRWHWRILAQVVAALVMVYMGGVRVEQLGPIFGLGAGSLGMLSVPFTVFATVGIINAINMIDGADGLAGLLVAAALAMLAAAAVYAGNDAFAGRILILFSAVAGFLVFNLRFPWRRRAKVFMGNAGSAFLGFAIAWCSFRLTQNPGHPVSPVLALWFVPIPIMDCLVLMVRRLRQRRSPFVADRSHIHHLMLDAGFGPTQAALLLTFFTLVCGLVAGQALRLDIPHPLLLLAFISMCVGWYALSSRRERVIAMFRWLHGWVPGKGQAAPQPVPVRQEAHVPNVRYQAVNERTLEEQAG